jgi:predicted nucleic acid-binding protein
MVSKVFLDVIVLLDFLLKRKDFESVEKILLSAKKRNLKLYVSSSIIQTASYYLQRSFPPDTCKQLLLELLKLVHILETTQEIIHQALNSSMDDIEDAIHYFTAIKYKMDYLISNDKQFQKAALPSLPILSIDEINNRLIY